jgi:hypothetical protein
LPPAVVVFDLYKFSSLRQDVVEHCECGLLSHGPGPFCPRCHPHFPRSLARAENSEYWHKSSKIQSTYLFLLNCASARRAGENARGPPVRMGTKLTPTGHAPIVTEPAVR